MVAATSRKYPEWKPGSWASSLGGDYFSEMRRLVDAMTGTWFSEDDHANGYADYIRARHVFGRMEIAQSKILPWLKEAIPGLERKTILEVGCGSGAATAPLAHASAFVHAFDLAQTELAAARCRLMGIDNVAFFQRAPGWTRDYADDPSTISPPVDIIVCYALLEHLLPLERIDLLSGAWKHLALGGHLVIIETPNRLYPYDWHSTQLPFADQIPDELAFLWNRFSPRGSVPADIAAGTRAEVLHGNRDRMFRFGKGASFHEFHCVLGAEAYAVANRTIMDRSQIQGYDQEDIRTLERQLGAVRPAVHPAFAQPCLDLILQKTGPARIA